MHFLLLALLLITTSLALPTSENGDTRADTCTDGYENHPLVLVSMDGFRAEYMSRGLTPNIQSVVDRGVSVPFMKPSYPTKTFPNHYSIVTGLYPESHGIIANSFFDPEFDEFFSTSSGTNLEGRWWGGNPVWNTVTDQGKKSAAMFWPGSDADIEGKYPTYYYLYNGSAPFAVRVQQVLDWLAFPEVRRPQWLCVYFEEPDLAGHTYGVDSDELKAALVSIDGYIGDLLDGIEAMNLTSCVNVILLADHGMADAGVEKMLMLSNYLPNLEEQGYMFYGAFSRIEVYDEYEALKPEMMQNLSCQDPALRQYDPTELPKRFHFVNNIRIEDIILDLDPGHTAEYDSEYFSEGEHGYENYYWELEALFAAAGPDFKVDFVAEPFQNLELYNLMCDLVGIVPSPNNGTEGSLYHLMANPPDYPTMPTESRPDVAEFPDESELTSRLNISECEGDLSEPEEWLYALDLTTEQQMDIETRHLPWGLPYTGNLSADILLLHHKDHITGYSQSLKMPLWTSFTLERSFEGTPGTRAAEWSSDVRLDETNTPTCTSYDALQSQNITQAPLFRPVFSVDKELDRIPFLISNAVPMSLDVEERWSELQDELIQRWVVSGLSDLHVITGPVFDSDSDSFVDNFTDFSPTPQPPSDFFTVLTRCDDHVMALRYCHPDDLDTLGFIYHDGQIASNCLSRDRYAQMFSCKIKDIEKATGLTFHTDLDYEDQTQLSIRIHSDIWDHCVPEGADDIFPSIIRSLFG